MPEKHTGDVAPALLVVRPGSYRAGAYVLSASGLLVFGGLFALVLIDWLQTGLDVARIWVFGALALIIPTALLAWALGRARRVRTRAGADFDELLLSKDTIVARHRYTGRAQELPRHAIARWLLIRHPASPGQAMAEWQLDLQLKDGRTLCSERVRFEDRLRRDLRRHGLAWDEEGT
jgi:hypothetical protein